MYTFFFWSRHWKKCSLSGKKMPLDSKSQSKLESRLYTFMTHHHVVPNEICCHLLRPSIILSLCLWFLWVVIHREVQFQAFLKINTLSGPSEVSLPSTGHLSPTDTLHHPPSLSCSAPFPHSYHYLGSSEITAHFHGCQHSFPTLFF